MLNGYLYERDLSILTKLIMPHEEADSASNISATVIKSFSGLKDNKQYSTNI
jgi:hypothetical protein